MAEGGSSVYFKCIRNPKANQGPRKPQNKIQDNTENSTPPKIIIKKRPPRKPKLQDGSEATFVSNNETLEHDVSFLQTDQENTSNNAKKIYQIEQMIGKTKEQFSVLQLNEEFFIPNDSESSSLNLMNKDKQKRVRKRRSRNKNDNSNINYINENLEPNNIEILDTNKSTSISNKKKQKKKKEKNDEHFHNDINYEIPKASAITNNNSDVEKKKEKDDKRFHYYKRVKDKIYNSQQKKFEDYDSQESSENSDSYSKEKKIEKKKQKKKRKKMFCEHLPIDVVKKLIVAQDAEKPNVIEGYIRINPRRNQNAYVFLASDNQDILIIGLKNRNRALEGDLVAVKINTPDEWFKLSENVYQKTGTVVSILEKVHPRKAVGILKKQDVFVFLQPRDCRVPLLKINPKTVPRNFYDNPELYKETLFLCNITDWNKVAFAEGEIHQLIGIKGDLSVESKAILLENDLILTPYENELLEDLPPPNYIPTELDFSERKDFTKTCIFTIDPATAKDLDDAMSCKLLENGNFEVGIHIADVTQFLKAFSPLDRKIAERATTVYMVDNVYHMLPEQLCLTCSLLPGQNKLAFSVVLEMTSLAEVVNYRFLKTVINSCCQMSYEQAQTMIDNESYNWVEDGSLKIIGKYKPSDLCKVVRNLYKLSKHLKNRRFTEGALKIDQPKLCVLLDKETKLPVSCKLEEKLESNSLIEEFMLLANMIVAKHLYEALPEVSLLRSHAQPTKLSKTRDLLTKFGILLDIESAGTLHNSLLMYQPTKDTKENNEIAQYRMMVINNLCAKSMMRAVYKCSATVTDKEKLKHYALNAEFYTHFTSPIRRYPDCVVHRLLYAAVKNEPLPSEWTSSMCAKVALNCNTKKYSAKIAQEQSNILYFTYMLDLQGSMNAIAIVMDVKERSADAMLCDTGLKIRLYFSDTIEETTSEFKMEHDVPTVKLTWAERQIIQVINIFSILHVKITKHPQLFRLQGIILPPTKVDLE